jgi:hypothetical protein
MYWLWILFVFPFLGSVVYFFAMMPKRLFLVVLLFCCLVHDAHKKTLPIGQGLFMRAHR